MVITTTTRGRLSSGASSEGSEGHPAAPDQQTNVSCYDRDKFAQKVNFCSGVMRITLVFIAAFFEAAAIQKDSQIKNFKFEAAWNGLPLMVCGALGIAASGSGSIRLRMTHLMTALCFGCMFSAIQWGLAWSSWAVDNSQDLPGAMYTAVVSLCGFAQLVTNGLCVFLNCGPVCCPEPDLSLLAVSTYGSSSRTNTTVPPASSETTGLPDQTRESSETRERNLGVPRSHRRSSPSASSGSPYSEYSHVDGSGGGPNLAYGDPPPSYDEVIQEHSNCGLPPPDYDSTTKEAFLS